MTQYVSPRFDWPRAPPPERPRPRQRKINNRKDSMKLVFTVSDAIHAAHVGGEVERKSAILEIDHLALPALVRDYLTEIANESSKKPCFLSMSISVLHDQPTNT